MSALSTASAIQTTAGRLRPLYQRSDLEPLISPRSIAIVGASNRKGSFGLRTLNNLSEFEGAVYPVNAKYDAIEAYKCYGSLQALPEVPDCVVLAVNRDIVEAEIAECVRAGVGGVIIYAGGFAETGRPDLISLQQRLVDLVEGTKTRLIGPNCLGICNYARKARIMFGRMPVSRPLTSHSIGIITQSGSVSMSLGQAIERGISISHALPVGNSADVGIADLVNYLVHDDDCRAIACVFEGVNQADHLIEAADIALAADKPLIVYKMAVGEEGAAAAFSHTGALAGSHAAYKAALQDRGVVILDRMEDVIETTAFFAKAGKPTGRGAAVVLGSGGLGVIAADKAEEHGVALPQPAGVTLDILKANVPEFGAARNPCDVTAQALNDDSALIACAGAMLADPAYSSLIVVHPYADEIGSSRVPLWIRLAAEYNKIICNYWSTEWLEGHGSREVETEPGIATFRSLDRCFGAIAAWHARELVRTRAHEKHARRTPLHVASEAARFMRGRAKTALTEREAKQVLSLYGIPVVQERLVQTAAEAVAVAGEVGFPVVLKVESPDILHKTEAGVVRLNLRSASEVSDAFAAILANAKAAVPSAHINGVLVQPMVPSGIEMMMGSRIDQQFGPLVVVGLGGIMVELMKDTAIATAPVSRHKALELLQSLRGFSALKGFRGMPPVDLDKLCDVIVRFSEFVADQGAGLSEVDVNPLICSGDRILAVDALVVASDQR